MRILAVSMVYQLSMNVPRAIAMAKTMNKTAIIRVENKTDAILFCIWSNLNDANLTKFKQLDLFKNKQFPETNVNFKPRNFGNLAE